MARRRVGGRGGFWIAALIVLILMVILIGAFGDFSGRDSVGDSVSVSPPTPAPTGPATFSVQVQLDNNAWCVLSPNTAARVYVDGSLFDFDVVDWSGSCRLRSVTDPGFVGMIGDLIEIRVNIPSCSPALDTTQFFVLGADPNLLDLGEFFGCD